MKQVLEDNGFVSKRIIRWVKTNPVPRNTNALYTQDYEFALWAVKGKKKWTFNKPNDAPFLRPEFKTAIPHGKERIHPTQKHLKVFEEIIKIHSNEGDLIVDPFAGSATCAIACKNLNRNFLGSEINKEFYEKAQERMKGIK